MRYFSYLSSLSMLMTLLSLPAMAAVVQFSPQGFVKNPVQVTVRFDTDMINMDYLRQAAPLKVRCKSAGVGRWLDSKNWVYDFTEAVPTGRNCSFRLKTGSKDLAGKALTGEQNWVFNTGGASVEQVWPDYGEIHENQLFAVLFDSEVQLSSVLSHGYCAVEGLKERIPLRMASAQERSQLLRGVFQDNETLNQARPKQVVWIGCGRRLPNEAKVSLLLNKGILNLQNLPSSTEWKESYSVRPSFSARISCDRVQAGRGCTPLLPIYLSFIAGISKQNAEKIQLTGLAGKLYPVQIQNADSEETSITFMPPFAPNSALSLSLPAGLTDLEGRPLINKARFPLTVKIDALPPLAKFAANFGIIEQNAGAVLPVTLRGLEPSGTGTAAVYRDTRIVDDVKIIEALKSLNLYGEYAYADEKEVKGKTVTVFRDDRNRSWFSEENNKAPAIALPKPNGAEAFEVVGIPLEKSGLHVVEVESRYLGSALTAAKQSPMFVRTSALVTNLAVHYKGGTSSENTLIWVTRLDNAAVVPQAMIAIRDCFGGLLWQGVTNEEGVSIANQQINNHRNCSNLFISARAKEANGAEQIGFVFSDWDEGISRWRFNLPDSSYDSPTLLKGILPRNLLRAGEVMQVKVVARVKNGQGWRMASPAELPESIQVNAPQVGDENVDAVSLPLVWENGRANAEWTIPDEAKLGRYTLTPKFKEGTNGNYSDTLASFRVSEFKLPTQRASIRVADGDLIQPDSVGVQVQVSYLSGGNAGGQAVKLRGKMESKSVRFADYKGFNFANGDLHANLLALKMPTEQMPEIYAAQQESLLETQSFNLDKQGGAKARFSHLPKLTRPYHILAELEYKDANGEVSTHAQTLNIWPSAVLVGMKLDNWLGSGKETPFSVVVLDLNGKPKAGVPVQVNAWIKQEFSHRKRQVGGFYAYDTITRARPYGVVCTGVSDTKGLLACKLNIRAAGEVILRAVASDEQGNPSTAIEEAYISGDENGWFVGTDSDRIDMLPERKEYQAGETAKLQVKMPFRHATALITLEREGIISHFVTEIDASNPIIQVPITADYAPNMFISALLVRGRMDEVQATALVDLGKPAFKLAYAEVRVNHASHALKVQLETDRKVYNTRDKAQLSLQVRRPDGTPAAHAEVAVAAIDEALLELADNDTWDLLTAMMQRRGMQIDTATAQLQVIGKRHFGKKALPAGGGGGKSSTRELFDTLLSWQPNVKLDAEGRANLTIPLNDALSSFRLVAIATEGNDLFGTGSTSIRATKELMLLPAVPNTVREGDEFKGGVTLRNAGSRALTVNLQAQVNSGAGDFSLQFPSQMIKIAAGEAREITWPIKVPIKITSLNWLIRAKSEGAEDSVKMSQSVRPALPLTTLQATVLQIDPASPTVIPVAVPKDAELYLGGGIDIMLRNTLGDASGAERYMRAYPYSCLEQQTSRAITLNDAAAWQGIQNNLSLYLDENGLAKYWPDMRSGSDILTSYVMNISHAAGWTVPDQAKEPMLSALTRFVEGKLTGCNCQWSEKDTQQRKLAALEALARYGVLRPQQLESLTIQPQVWNDDELMHWINILHYSPTLAKHKEWQNTALNLLRARLVKQGTSLNFASPKNGNWWSMSSTDQNAARTLLVSVLEPTWQPEQLSLVNGLMFRQHNGNGWSGTTSNAWASLAIRQFQQQSVGVVNGTTQASYAKQNQTLAWDKLPKGGKLHFDWQTAPDSLNLTHLGTGKPIATVQTIAAIPLKTPLSAGFSVQKTITPIEVKQAGKYSTGDTYRIALDISSQNGMGWVALNDPIPAGAVILGRGLKTDSQLLQEGEYNEGGWWSFVEPSYEAYRVYYEYLEGGKLHVEYTLRLNTAGTFKLPPTKIEAMYSPEMFGEVPNAIWKVE